jgi:hypothetical protein
MEEMGDPTGSSWHNKRLHRIAKQTRLPVSRSVRQAFIEEKEEWKRKAAEQKVVSQHVC